MYRPQSIVLACAIALTAGCANNKNHPQPSAQGQSQSQIAQSDASGGADAAPAAPAPAAPDVETGTLAGAWQLAMPRRDQQSAAIAATDGTHVTIHAGDNLSGNYVVQGSYLLILTRDEKLRPLAWRINSPDSITVVRTADLGAGGTDYTGVTLVRAVSEPAAPTDAAAATDTDEIPTE